MYFWGLGRAVCCIGRLEYMGLLPGIFGQVGKAYCEFVQDLRKNRFGVGLTLSGQASAGVAKDAPATSCRERKVHKAWEV